MKKLIPALCMLLVAAALLGTSTFAWFSMSTSVEAGGMQVKATASKNLLISLSESSGYGSGVTLPINNTTMTPVSTTGGDVVAPVFSKLNVAGSMSQDSYATAGDTTMQAAVEGTDYAKTTVYLKVVGQTGQNLKAAISATNGGEKNIDKALRVMLVDKTDPSAVKTYIFMPVTGAEYGTSGKAIESLDGSNKGVLGNITTIKDGDDILIASMTADTVYKFDVYVWYEGEDKSCTAANTVDMATTTLGITFSIAS